MRLAHSTWYDVQEYLQSRTDVLIPIGATEQHGPLGIIGTDFLCAEGLAAAAGEREGILVAPVLPIGMSLHHLGFPGSLSLKPQTLIAVVCDVLDSLYSAGFNRCHFINGHGGNIASLQAAFSAAYHVHPHLRCMLTNWWDLPNVRETIQDRFGEGEGQHGTPSELSLCGYLHPVHRAEIKPASPPTGIGQGLYSAADFRQRFPDGRVGANQLLADPEIGKILLELGAKNIGEKHRQWLASA